MRNVLLVIKYEIQTTLGKRSFWIMTFLFPLLIVGLNVGMQIVAQNAFDDEQVVGGEQPGTPGEATGYVDQAGIIAQLPSGLPPGMVQSFPDKASAHAALQAGTITRYYLIPADWLQSGNVVMVASEFNIMGALTGDRLFEYIVSYNLVGDPVRASLAIDPTPRIEEHALATQAADRANPLTFLVPYAVMFIFFFLLTISGGFMLQSVTKEKETRTVEVLLLSLRPRELMLGKVLGLGVVALFQMAVWLGVGFLALNQGQRMLPAASSYALPPGFVVWAVLYFLLGYLLYASVLGAIGALAPSMREGSQFTFVAMLPLMIPLLMNVAFTETPNGALATFLSLFPLTAPTAMITRLSTGGVPFWQAAVGLAGLAVTAYVFVLLSARFFRAETLLSTAGMKWQRIIQELRQ